MDAFSDIDLLLACEPADLVTLLEDRAALAAQLGELVAYFTGEHVGEPRLMKLSSLSPRYDLSLRSTQPMVVAYLIDRLCIR